MVIDDSSDVPVARSLAGLSASVASKVQVLRQTASEGYIVARNTIMRRATTEYVLLMDDDAYLLDAAGMQEALEIIDGHAEIGAIGFAQADADGKPWPAAMQPAPVSYRCRVPSFIGFAHLLRRRTFHEVGGYREQLHFYGEEKGFCARLLRSGYQVLYLPDVLVAHVPDPEGRSNARYLRYVVRNDCLFALYNLPWLAACLALPIRLARYFRMKRTHPARDFGAFFWIISQIGRAMPEVVRTRAPLGWKDLASWRRLRRQPPAWRRRNGPFRETGADGMRITVGIPTRDRPDALATALSALAVIADRIDAIIVVDDASEVPVDRITSGVPAALLDRLQIHRQARSIANIAARNLIMQTAKTEYVLLCDDDAYLVDSRTVDRGLTSMAGDPAVAAVGFAMAESSGALWPLPFQPSSDSRPCLVSSYIGFAHLIRRSAFLEVGGYRVLWRRHGEEKECCLRLIDAGYDIVYLPDPPVVHTSHPAGRNEQRYLRYIIRNDCLGALFNQPVLVALVSVPMHLARYIQMRRAGKVHDPWGLLWIVHQLFIHLPTIARERRPVKWSTVRRWRQLRRSSPIYDRVPVHT
jgi:GT2 family glycosyltransferase